jgi:hypothetical protein
VQISKDSFVYKVAYGYEKEYNRPASGSLCSLLGHFFLSLLILTPSNFLLNLALGVVFGFFGLLSGYRLALKDDGPKNDIFVKIEKWPTIQGHRALPIVIIPALGFVTGLTWLLILVRSDLLALLMNPFFWFATSAVITLTLLTWGIRSFLRSESYSIFRAYLKAKKDKVCPLVTFVSDH